MITRRVCEGYVLQHPFLLKGGEQMSLNKVKNIRFASAKLVSSDGTLKFDVDGVAEVKSEELYKELLEMPGFEPFGVVTDEEVEEPEPEPEPIAEPEPEPEPTVEPETEPEPIAEPEPTVEPEPEDEEEDNHEDEYTEEQLQEKSIKQLLYLAKTKKIEVNPNLKKAEIIQTILDSLDN